ncbi:MAG: CvpA family protein, partial [Mobilitalea sp.]
MKVGFVKKVFSLCFMIVAVILTIWINPYVNDFMRGNDQISGSISTKVETVFHLENEKEADVSVQTEQIEGLSLPQSIKDSLVKNNTADVYEALSINSFKEYVTTYLSGIIINALAFIITFLVILIALWIVSIALDLISKLPLINQINKTAGLLAGIVHGLVIIWLFCILVTVFGGTEFGQKALQMIGESQLLSFIYNNNFLLQFVTGATKMFF